jgi:hypothetical protein
MTRERMVESLDWLTLLGLVMFFVSVLNPWVLIFMVVLPAIASIALSNAWLVAILGGLSGLDDGER